MPPGYIDQDICELRASEVSLMARERLLCDKLSLYGVEKNNRSSSDYIIGILYFRSGPEGPELEG